MEKIILQPKTKEQLEALKAMAKALEINYSTGDKENTKKKKQALPAGFVPGKTENLSKALKEVCGMWADRQDMEDITEWRRKLWERKS
jgi:hypothetical protein